MAQTQIESKEQREVVAVSKASYRGFEIIETRDGCVFFLNGRQYDFVNINEATACIDTIYAMAARAVIQ